MTETAAVEPEPSWTDRFADDVRAALDGEHRPRWANGKPCPYHAGDQCCADCCTTCYLEETLDELGLPTKEGETP